MIKKIAIIVLTAVMAMSTLVHADDDYYGRKAKVFGVVTAVDLANNTVTIRATNGINETFFVDAATTIEVDGWFWDSYIMLSELKIGARVKAKYYTMGMVYNNGIPMQGADMNKRILRTIDVQ